MRSSAFAPTARMFLLNAPPLAAFPTQWPPFGCNPAPCCVPSAVADIPVAADVEGAADSPQSEASSLPVNLEYERIMQKNRKGELHIDRGLKPSPALFRAHAREKAALIVPAHFRDIKEEEGSDFEALALDSDSDDSVDRGIEEAIQEYLKNKGSAAPSSCVPAAKSPNASAENDGDQVKAAQSSAPARRSPIKMVTSPKVCESIPMQSLSRCSSPDSVGSDDSFELSIKQEIEQFLIEKKLQNNPSDSGAGKKPASHTAAKLKPKPIKVEKASPKQGPKGPAVKTASESLNLLPKNVKPKAECAKSNFHLKPAPGPTKPTISRQLALPSAQCADLSDSSSDDGIEEAIQLYQLEKIRLEGNLSSATRTFPERDGKSTTNAASDVIHCQIKNAPPEPQKKPDYRKRKLSSLKPAASQDSLSKRAHHSADERGLEYQPEGAALRRAETAAELMCAEAILDISKAILPSQPERSLAVSQDKPPAQPPSPCASDSSVDSNDSIEQEIRTFLAQKAQAEGLCTTSAKQSPKEQRSEPSKQLPLPSTKAVGTCKGKVNDNKVVPKDSPGKAIECLNVECSPVHSSSHFGQHLKGKAAEPCPDSSNKPHCQEEDAKNHIIQAMESLESSPGKSGGRRKSYIKVRSNYSGDKSSSLDSDEDLDSAIKDLLRSKRKCKKRPKDGRPQCKKKVRFGETTTRPLEAAGGAEQKDCSPKLMVVKSCLVTGDPKDISSKKSKTSLKLKEDKKVPVGSTESSSVTKPVECKPACASDKSVEISSALPDPQDSSSVDSDDSIEQEIRKFLADRARESAELSAAQKTAAPAIPPAAIKTEPAPAPIPTPAPIKKEPGVLSSSVTETILQKVREKDRSAATHPTIIQRVYGYKDTLSSVVGLQQPPTGIAKAAAPVRSVIVPRECIARPADKKLPVAPDRVLVKTGVNSSQGNIPLSGNFVAGLKYISGTEQQLLLNVGKTGAARLASDFYSPAGTIAQLGNCPKKTLILEQPKVVQAPAFSLGTPMVRPALYVVTTKVVQETSASLCLPINAATYDTGLNLMSIQYCPSQVAPRPSACTAPFTFQQARNSEAMVITPGKAGEIPTLITKARARQTTSGLLDGESRCPNVTPRAAEEIEPGASEEKVSSIDPGWSVPLCISMSPAGIYKRQHLRRRAEQVMAQLLKARTPFTRVRPSSCSVSCLHHRDRFSRR